MKVKDLKKVLDKYDEEIEVIYRVNSDYSRLEEDEIRTIRAVPKDFWVMRSHPTMSDENKAVEQEFLVFPGF